jgi:phosphoenolpyruvate synthase/pyruvate phosphate dikinase
VRALLGGKGANLAEMTRVGVPVPHGFTVTTEACNAYLDAGENFPAGMWEQDSAVRSSSIGACLAGLSKYTAILFIVPILLFVIFKKRTNPKMEIQRRGRAIFSLRVNLENQINGKKVIVMANRI